MKRFVWWLVFILCLGGITTTAMQQHYYPRFHRYALTRVDEVTGIDMIKDAATQKCYAVYVVSEGIGLRPPKSVTTLGQVPCDPIPVPPKVGDVPPASVIR